MKITDKYLALTETMTAILEEMTRVCGALSPMARKYYAVLDGCYVGIAHNRAVETLYLRNCQTLYVWPTGTGKKDRRRV